MTASFVDVLAERNPRQLAELARLTERRMKEQQAQYPCAAAARISNLELPCELEHPRLEITMHP